MNLNSVNIYWFVVPLAIAISLVYAASRHESWKRIWMHAAKLCAFILLVLLVTTLALLAINTQV